MDILFTKFNYYKTKLNLIFYIKYFIFFRSQNILSINYLNYYKKHQSDSLIGFLETG